MLGYSLKELKSFSTNEAHFIVTNWSPITEEEAIKINPYLTKWINLHNEQKIAIYFYRCNLLNNNKCTVHKKGQPHVCTGYPFYGRHHGMNYSFYTDTCGYMKELKEMNNNEKY
jgi:hypothetical protein